MTSSDSSDNSSTSTDSSLHTEHNEDVEKSDCVKKESIEKDFTTQEEENKDFINDVDSDDYRKIFLSRIASDFNKDSIIRIFELEFGRNCIEEVALSVRHDDNNEEEGGENETNTSSKKNSSEEINHRGFGFVTMSSVEKRNEAIKKGTVRGTAKKSSKRKHTMYIRPIVRQDDISFQAEKGDGNESNNQGGENICYLWTNFRCPYGDSCKFEHKGKGGCIEATKSSSDPASKMKKQKCFSYKKTGKCKLGEGCPYNHDFEVTVKPKKEESTKRDPKDVDCINWKTKGRCRKGDKCPYRHDEIIRKAFLEKKDKKDKKKKRGRNEKAQPLSVRVFGLNYDTKEEDIREYFKDCGVIKEITFPTFEDSGRSKGYCGVLFTSPKATAKATELDGSSLLGRWLSIQAGKMYLKQWEEMEKERAEKNNCGEITLGEFGQKAKKRKKHGFKDD